MKLIKINPDHYVIVDDSEIKEGDWFLNIIQKEIYCNDIPNYDVNKKYLKKITHSTQPLDSKGYWGKVMPLTLTIPEVKELIDDVDVEEKAEKFIGCKYDDIEDSIDQIGYDSFIRGYNQALEDNKEKKYTEEDIKSAIIFGYNKRTFDVEKIMNSQIDEEFIQSLQPQTSWQLEIIDGKLKLK